MKYGDDLYFIREHTFYDDAGKAVVIPSGQKARYLTEEKTRTYVRAMGRLFWVDTLKLSTKAPPGQPTSLWSDRREPYALRCPPSTTVTFDVTSGEIFFRIPDMPSARVAFAERLRALADSLEKS